MDPDSRRPRGRDVARLRVTVSDGRGRAVRERGLARWLAAVAPASAKGEVAVALVSDARIRALNRRYRRKDYATDVLSFPGTPTHSPFLGDVVIATGVARRQARDAGHRYTDELRVLALHGLLHLLGYDHEDIRDRGRMARLEARLRRRGGLGAGLIERGFRPPRETRKRAGVPAYAGRGDGNRPATARSRRSARGTIARGGGGPREH